MSTLYFAHSISKSWETFKDWDWDETPINFLVSYFYLKDYDTKAEKASFKPRLLMLDSGAFSAYNAGKTIDIHDLVKETKQKRWHESVALDVINDEKASIKNVAYMRRLGSTAYPVFHIGESFNTLKFYCNAYPKVGLSCRFGETVTESYKWLDECFRQAWPHPFHSFGWVADKLLKTYPFHSADSTGWMRPHVYGNWRSLGGARVRNSWNYSLRSEIMRWVELEHYCKARWKKELSRWPETITK